MAPPPRLGPAVRPVDRGAPLGVAGTVVLVLALELGLDHVEELPVQPFDQQNRVEIYLFHGCVPAVREIALSAPIVARIAEIFVNLGTIPSNI